MPAPCPEPPSLFWTKGFDPDLHLLEVRDDPDAPWTRRALAGASVAMPLEEGRVASAALCAALEAICSGEGDGKRQLAAILSAPGHDYQRCLWFNLAGRHPLCALADLDWLCRAMQARCALGDAVRAMGIDLLLADPPYKVDQRDGPAGDFEADFAMGPLWDGFVATL